MELKKSNCMARVRLGRLAFTRASGGLPFLLVELVEELVWASSEATGLGDDAENLRIRGKTLEMSPNPRWLIFHRFLCADAIGRT